MADGTLEARELEAFVVQLGVELNAAGEPAYAVQDRLVEVAHAYGATEARVTAFPTYLMVTMGIGEPATLELTSVAAVPRLDQIAALDRLLTEAQQGRVVPAEGMRRLHEMHALRLRFGRTQSLVGYSVLTVGLCLILQPARRDLVAAAAFGALVGLLRSLHLRRATQFLLPVMAAFCVSGLSALAVKHGITDPGIRPMVASLVVFLPGAMLTTAVLELTAGQMVSGASRLVAGIMQLALLSFGIMAGIEAVGVPSPEVLSGSPDVMGEWAPWAGVLVFAIGVTVAYSAPPRAFPTLLIVLYAAWAGQVVGGALLGAYLSAFVGATVMTPVAYFVSRLPSAMPQLASFLPGFWLLVPGAIGLIGLTEFASSGLAARQDLLATAVSIFAVAIGVLCGTLLFTWMLGTTRFLTGLSRSVGAHTWRRHQA